MTTHITTAVDIHAPIGEVWAVLTDLEQWPAWSTFTATTGRISTGSRLRLTMPGFTFRPTVIILDPGREFAWEGVLLAPRLFRGRHTFTLEQTSINTTRLVNDEAFDGLLTTITAPLLHHAPTQHNGYDTFNQALKTRSEHLTTRRLAVAH